jgi:hypothetical protein
MKEGEASSPSTYVTPRRKRKRRGTDFSNWKARHRREARRMVEVGNNLPSTPVKGGVEGPGFSTKFCSIRKLNLESIVEREEELIEDTIADCDQHDLYYSEGKGIKMTRGRPLQCKETLQSPQPPICRVDSPSTEIDDCDSEPGQGKTESGKGLSQGSMEPGDGALQGSMDEGDDALQGSMDGAGTNHEVQDVEGAGAVQQHEAAASEEEVSNNVSQLPYF